MAVNPPPINIPDIPDVRLRTFLKQLKDAFYLLWFQTGAGTGLVGITGGGTGADTAAGARTNLGLAIGSNVQAYDAGLNSIAGLTTAADRMIYTTNADVYAVTTFTAAARSLVDDATTDAMLTTLGGTTAGQSLFKLSNPSAIRFIRINADNTVTARADSDFRTDIGLGTIATQAANNVAITGGSINATTIGATTKAAGSFSVFNLDKTITPAATTGAQTINKPAGSVNFAATDTSLVVTNSLVSTSSVILATVTTNDATMKTVLCVAGSGSFTIHANAAATAETRVDFLVLN